MMIHDSSEISEAIQKFERLLSRPLITNGRVGQSCFWKRGWISAPLIAV